MYEESARVELKEVLTEDVRNEIDAFLNTHGGTIYIGVDNNGKVKPISDSKERDYIDSKVSNWIRDVYYPIPSTLLNCYFNGDNVYVIEIKEGNNKPYYFKEKGPKPSGVFIREGRSTRKATESEILMMIMESNRYSYEDDISDEQDLTFKYFFEICDENDIAHDKRHLKSLRLISKDDKYTNLAFMLSDQSTITAKFAKYDKIIRWFPVLNSHGRNIILVCIKH